MNRSAKQRSDFDGPAKLHAGHVKRSLGRGAGKAWRNDAEHPLTMAFARGQLDHGSPRHSADDRYEAGNEYRRLFEAMQPRGRDSTDRDPLGTGCATGAPIAITMADAMKKIVAIDSHLSARDRAIVRHVCGEGWFPNDAIREACGDAYAKATAARFNEALDALLDAFAQARRTKYAVAPRLS